MKKRIITATMNTCTFCIGILVFFASPSNNTLGTMVMLSFTAVPGAIYIIAGLMTATPVRPPAAKAKPEYVRAKRGHTMHGGAANE
ncbi:MAG: hypothetical protein ACK5L3_13685 [Oscillospiraceae bacterium]